MMENEILNSMQEQMKQLETEFNQVKESLQTLEDNYKISKEQHLNRIAQIQGAYTALHTQYEKYAKQPEQPKVEEKPVEEPVVETKPVGKVVEMKKETKPKVEPKPKAEPKSTKALTPEEIAKLKQVTNTPKVDAKGNEIPEYLQ